MNIFKLAVDTLYLTIALQIFLFVIDSISVTNFGLKTYTPLGFLLLYIYMIPVIALIRVSQTKK